MSDIIDYNVTSLTPHIPCRVAYTINNRQPVRSTIIGEQPFFYMDADIDDEEFEELSEAELSILAGELETLKREIEVFDRMSDTNKTDKGCLYEQIGENIIDVTNEKLQKEQDIKEIINIVSQSRMGDAFLKRAQGNGLKISYYQGCESAYYDQNGLAICLSPSLEISEQVLLLVRELRRHWQAHEGALLHPLGFHPDQAILINRLQMADLSVAMVRVAWELQLCGYKEAWNRIEKSSLADLGRALAREAYTDFRTLNNGISSQAVFEAWFLSERCKTADKELIQMMLSDHDSMISNLDNATYQMTPAIIAAIGTVPFGKNYLSMHAPVIMDDAIFNEVRDRSNANFLWFVKFERSFRETEQYLQESSDHTAERPFGEFSENEQDDDDANLFSGSTPRFPVSPVGNGEIIKLFPQTTQSKDGDNGDAGRNLISSKDEYSSKSADIIDLHTLK